MVFDTTTSYEECSLSWREKNEQPINLPSLQLLLQYFWDFTTDVNIAILLISTANNTPFYR